MWPSWKYLLEAILAMLLCAHAGCTSMDTSCIDPSGEHVFTPPPQPAYYNPNDERYFDDPMGRIPTDDVAVQIRPQELVAPVGSEVVLIAGVCGPDGYLRTNRRLEWTIAAGSVGHFVAIEKGTGVDLLVGDFNRPHKVDATFAVGSTSRDNIRLNRGQCRSDQDQFVRRGEGWISLTSPVEGTSNITVLAPEVYAWKDRLKSAMVHWVDVLPQYPPPSIDPVGGRHVFTTTVAHHSNGSPCEGWRVRYEIVSGPPAGFAPDGAQVIEAPTNSAGQAGVELFQKQPSPGTNQIRIQVIRPADAAGAGGKKLIVDTNTTTETWTVPSSTVRPSESGSMAPTPSGAGTTFAAPSIEVRVTGPSPDTVTVGSRYTFQVTITNRGQKAAGNLQIRDRFDQGLEHKGDEGKNVLAHELGDLAPGASKRLAIEFGVTKPGRLCHTVEVSGPEISTASATGCVTGIGEAAAPPPSLPLPSNSGQANPSLPTLPPLPPPLAVKITGPTQMRVGETARFLIDVTNQGTSPLRNVKLLDRFDVPLDPSLATDGYRLEDRSLVWMIDELAVGKTMHYEIQCKCSSAAARTCNRASVSLPDGTHADEEVCLEIRP